MKIKPLNFIALALIPIALLTFSTSALSFVLCFGDDGYTRVEQASVNGCVNCEEVSNTHGGYKVNSLSTRVDKRTPSCSDLLLSNDSLVYFKRSIKAADIPILEESRASLYTPSNVHSIPKATIVQLQRVSQTILAHRTIVLLN
jgi:hypothetical protein